MYLSPAFSWRTQEEIQFLHEVNGKTGFRLYWIDIVRPLLEGIAARSLLEIGAWNGEHTALLLDYCEATGGFLTVIEPCVRPALRDVIKRTTKAHLIEAKSEEALPRILRTVDAVMLEGDLNYHTVLGDLRNIRMLGERYGAPFPVVFLRAVGWPYARRDMYYEPKDLPGGAVHTWDRKGMTPWCRALVDHLINAEYANAVIEGGERNGVLTAAEDFLKETEGALRLWMLPANNGLAIVYQAGSAVARYVANELEIPRAMARFVETWEIARLNEQILRRDQGRGVRAHLARAVGWAKRPLRMLAHLVLPSDARPESK